MKYRNINTGIIVEPPCKISAQAFAQSPIWEEVKECLKSAKTRTSAENTQTNTSPADTEAIAKTERDGKKSATRTKKSS